MWAWWVNPREIRDGKEPGRFMKREREREEWVLFRGHSMCGLWAVVPS
jgi:hypothetical protein